MAVVDDARELAGVITEWGFVRATAAGTALATPGETIMPREGVTAGPGNSLLEGLRRLEYYDSARCRSSATGASSESSPPTFWPPDPSLAFSRDRRQIASPAR
jgi:hypothetical protein